MYTALTVAGSDSIGGAGIQADIKTMTMNGVYAMSCITALTAQNTLGVTAIHDVDAGFLEKQIDAVFEDVFPDSVKIGMVSAAPLIECIAAAVNKYKPSSVVIDPVMVSASGSVLISQGAMASLTELLLPLGTVLTPNIYEAAILAGFDVKDPGGMEKAAEAIYKKFGNACLVKGGHGVNDANDFLFSSGGGRWFEAEYADNPNTHGTGCTLSSAICANLAKGFGLEESIARAKLYVSGALAAGLDLGRGKGPLPHNFDLSGRFTEHK
ncbi:MAG: bifunctional hydroxymethylpyrimidine kinase/phosphomethylpyrimidine kinase [Abditibacteriota bacterium]|nr:bifunctional hydroxymethylpyrimidine kinase/phosphomethylpyrimidine kinase [Abditibacteriota bacterium]